jgi:pimeloyl-ACP methyl ester carboxylesterase
LTGRPDGRPVRLVCCGKALEAMSKFLAGWSVRRSVKRVRWAVLAIGLAACMPPSWGAGALLHPRRTRVTANPALAHHDVAFRSEGLTLRGWVFPATGARRGVTVVYLHGSGDNRSSGVWIAEQLVADGFDVLAYDSRAHGASEGAACTYGFYEKRDLGRALDMLGIDRAILLGVSLGGAVALQAASHEARVLGVVAVAPFSDLESIARQRAPFFASNHQIAEALALAEKEAHFRIADVSPLESARAIRVPVLLVHGANDMETRPAHSELLYAALGGPKRRVLVDGAAHEDALGKAWSDVRSWIDATATASRAAR